MTVNRESIMPRGLDHIVHAVHDLDAAGEAYARLGFTVGARNRHPWGTHNRIVQFPGVFIELLGVGEPALIPPATPRSVSFGAFTREFLARHEGLSMLVLEGKGAAADAAAFRAANIGDFDVFDFEREGKRPDGASVKVAFSLAFAEDKRAPDTGFFTCQQHYPENFCRVLRASCSSPRTRPTTTYSSRPSPASPTSPRPRPASPSKRRAARSR
jgi:hypothetical protein